MGKYIPPEKMTVEQILEVIEAAYTRWNYIANNGCQDPFWEDGFNMNLVRKHIMYWYSILATKETELGETESQQEQISFFAPDKKEDKEDNVVSFTLRPIPPEVPSNYMVANCKYSNRLKGKNGQNLIWGEPGQYKA